MSDEIKEILSKMERLIVYGQYDAYYNLEKQILDYITNLQEAFEKSYTEEQLDFAVNEVKEQVKAEHQLNNQLHNEIDKLRVKNYELQQKVSQYENPDDLTLFYMWIDEKAKDKMKKLENEVANLKQQNAMITRLGEVYKARCEKASELIHDIYFRIDFNNLCNATWVGIKLDETSQGNDLLNILQGSDKE